MGICGRCRLSLLETGFIQILASDSETGNFPSAGLTGNERVDGNLLDDAFFLLLPQLEIHGCSQHQVTLQEENRSQTHVEVTSGAARPC